MTEETLLKHTLELAELVMNAIIYLLYFLNTEESKKAKNSDKKVGKMIIDDIPDELKSDR